MKKKIDIMSEKKKTFCTQLNYNNLLLLVVIAEFNSLLLK